MIDAYADRWALVTGASSGIGAEFARRLAARGMHLVLVARREDRLKELANELDTRHGTRSRIISKDLSKPGSRKELVDELEGEGIDIELLVNNAGFAVVGGIGQTSLDDVMDMISVNIAALTELTERVLPGMKERGHGAIINIASVAAFQPVAYMSAYAASKSYVLHYTEALWAEARDSNVTLMALCPGVTRTEFFDVAGVSGWLKKQSAQTPEQVVKTALKYIEKKRSFVISGWKNSLLAFMVRLAPRKMVVLESRKYFRPRKQKDSASEPNTDGEQPSEKRESLPTSNSD